MALDRYLRLHSGPTAPSVENKPRSVGGAAKDRKMPRECVEYENRVRELAGRPPSEEDFKALAGHEDACPSGQHSEEGVERALGLPRGALRDGSPDHHLRPAREIVDELIEKYLKGLAATEAK